MSTIECPCPWVHLAEQCKNEADPDALAELLDELIGEGMEEDVALITPLLCDLLSTEKTDLCYELCHSLLYARYPIDDALAERLKPLVYHESRRMSMSALKVILNQEQRKGLDYWETIREHVSEDRRVIGDYMRDTYHGPGAAQT